MATVYRLGFGIDRTEASEPLRWWRAL